MNDTTKWILIAIVGIIVVILIGAYALSNGSNQPAASATPTAAASATATPTSITPVPSATIVPTATTLATATPTATPKPSGSSGVKQTEFGYYITYPPFSYNEVAVNPAYVPTGATTTPTPPSPSPSPTPEGTVTFVYGYGSVNWNYGEPWSSSSVGCGEPAGGYLPVYFLLHRTGDVSSAYWTDIEVSASISGWGYNSANPGFNAGSDEMIYELDLPVSYLRDNVYTEVTLTLDDPDPYTATPHQVFWLYINGDLT